MLELVPFAGPCQSRAQACRSRGSTGSRPAQRQAAGHRDAALCRERHSGEADRLGCCVLHICGESPQCSACHVRSHSGVCAHHKCCPVKRGSPQSSLW